MHDNHYSQRLSVDELTDMNTPLPAPTPRAKPPVPTPDPTAVLLSMENWNALVRTLNRISESNAATRKEMERLGYEMTAEVKSIVKFETRMALDEQKRETWKKIDEMTAAAKEQVGRAAEEASRKIGRRTHRDEAMWWIKIGTCAFVVIFEILRFVGLVF